MNNLIDMQNGTSLAAVSGYKQIPTDIKDYISSLSKGSENVLQILINNGIVNAAEVADSIDEMRKDAIKEKHKFAITKQFNKDGSFRRYNTYVTDNSRPGKRRPVSATTLDALYDKLYEEYYKAYTLTKLFNRWQNYSKTNTNRTAKTIREDFYTYKKYLKGKAITKKDIRQLTVGDFMKFFDNLFTTNPTKHNVSAVRTLINQLYMQAVRDGIPIASPLNMIDFKHRQYKEVDNDNKYYTEEERNTLISYILGLENKNIYDYAILFLFCFPIRIGELKGLQWADVSDTQIYVHQQLGYENKLKDVKKARKTGHRYIDIPDLGKLILSSIEMQGDFVFMKNGKPLLTDVFNAQLKRRCEKAGVPYFSSHKIRFSGCVLMLDNGIDLSDA